MADLAKYANQSLWRVELIYNNKSYGLFNVGEVSHGAEAGRAIDPEDGDVPMGGEQTSEDIELSRPWKLGRETVHWPVLKAARGSGSGQALVHEIDPDTKQPVSSQPVETLEVKLISCARSETERGSTDPTTVTYGFQVKA